MHPCCGQTTIPLHGTTKLQSEYSKAGILWSSRHKLSEGAVGKARSLPGQAPEESQLLDSAMSLP